MLSVLFDSLLRLWRKSLSFILVIAILISVIAVAMLATKFRTRPLISSQPTVEKIRDISQLSVLNVSVSDVIEISDPKRLLGIQYSTDEVLFVTRGDADIGVDLEALEVTVDERSHTAHIHLPTPKVSRARLDMNKTQVFDGYGNPIGLSSRTPLPAVAARIAQEHVKQLAGAPDFIDRAKRRTESLITGYLGDFGWKAVLDWRDDIPDASRVPVVPPEVRSNSDIPNSGRK